MTKRSLNISICVVLYRSEEESTIFHQQLMESLREHNNFEVKYYDNSPTDILRQPMGIHPYGDTVTYVHDQRNLGFSYANNCLIMQSKYNKILLLNPDVYGFYPSIWDLIANQTVSDCIIFAKLLNSDGSAQDCVGEVTSIRRAFMPQVNYNTIESKIKIGSGIMAFMLTSKDVLAHVGLLDCRYSLYAEDMDWCYRATKFGYDLIYQPKIILTHTGGASAKDRWSSKTTLHRKYQGERLFIDIHFRGTYWLAMRFLNIIKRLKVFIRA